jgi:hypothetical protein
MECEDLSRNASSSRALPIAKLIREASEDPAVPLHWGLNERGMQATNELTGEDLAYVQQEWHAARHEAIQRAKNMAARNASKQLVNRILEPYTHITVVVTATEWNNFLALRDHKDAEPHIQILAREVRKCLENDPIQDLAPGEWHLPFVEQSDWLTISTKVAWKDEVNALDMARKLSVARCASTSYKTVDGFDMTLERAIDLHDKLLASTPLHASPAEHQLQADDWSDHEGIGHNAGWQNEHQHGNTIGFRQYRKQLANECVPG